MASPSDHATSQLRRSRMRQMVLPLVDMLFVVTLVLIPVVWLVDPLRLTCGPVRFHLGWGLKVLLGPALLLALRFGVRKWVRISQPDATGLLDMKWVVLGCKLLVSLYMTVSVLEVGLAAIGYELEMAPVIFSLKDGSGKVQKEKGYADPELIYKFRKGEIYHGMKINSLGFRDREVDPVKDEGVVRVICMGDSCTAQGMPGYSGYLHDMLTEEPIADRPWEAFNMAVYGYSSVQGLRVFQKQGKFLEPDVVTLYYGWNDHWLHTQSDRARMAVRMSGLEARLYERLREKRTFMMLKQITDPTLRFNKARDEAGPRVPHDEYRVVLTEFVEEIRRAGATPLLITAARRNADTENVHAEYPEVEIDFNVVHDEYTDITREVAADRDVDLLDLHRALADEKYDDFFMEDGIHLTQDGLHFIATALYKKLQDMQRRDRVVSLAGETCDGCDEGCRHGS